MGRTIAQIRIDGQTAEHLATTCERLSSLPKGDIFSKLSAVTPQIERLTHGGFSSDEHERELKQVVQDASEDLAQLSFPESLVRRSEHATRFPGAHDVLISVKEFAARFSGHGFGIFTGIYFDFRPANMDEVVIPLTIGNDKNPVTGSYSLEYSDKPGIPNGIVQIVEGDE